MLGVEKWDGSEDNTFSLTLDTKQKACVEAYDISAYIIPLNIVSYSAEQLPTVLCFSVEN